MNGSLPERLLNILRVGFTPAPRSSRNGWDGPFRGTVAGPGQGALAGLRPLRTFRHGLGQARQDCFQWLVFSTSVFQQVEIHLVAHETDALGDREGVAQAFVLLLGDDQPLNSIALLR